MSEQEIRKVVEQGEEEKLIEIPPGARTLVMWLSAEGKISIRATFNDRITMYGMLKAAEVALSKQEEKRIISIPGLRLPMSGRN